MDCFCWITSCVRYEQSLEGSALIMKVLFSFDVSDVFRGGSEVVRTFSYRSRVSSQESHSTYSGSPILLLGHIFLGISALSSSPGLQLSNLLFGGNSCKLLTPKFSLILGVFQSHWTDCFYITINVPRSLFPDFCSSRIETKTVSSG